MKNACLLLALGLVACNTTPEKKPTPATIETVMPPDNTVVEEGKLEAEPDTTAATETVNSENKTFENQRFRNVSARKTGENTYRISGEGQIFEANFGWVIEDGHNELASGHQMTDAGAPEWGKFSFEVQAKKERPNSTLHIILFETSAKDGSRQHELPVALP